MRFGKKLFAPEGSQTKLETRNTNSFICLIIFLKTVLVYFGKPNIFGAQSWLGSTSDTWGIRETGSLSELPVILLYDKAPSTAAALEARRWNMSCMLRLPYTIDEFHVPWILSVEVFFPLEYSKIQWKSMGLDMFTPSFQGFDSGSNDFIAKPLDPQLVREKAESKCRLRMEKIQSGLFFLAQLRLKKLHFVLVF